MIVVIYIDFVFRGPLGRILHSNRCHPLKIKVILILIIMYSFFVLKK